jgi:hypothetical protein
MKIIKFLFCAFIVVNSYKVRADSPLTSTDFYKAYETQSIIKSTPHMGLITNEMLQFLTDPSAPIDVKLALVNKLGWDIDGKNNSELFLQFIQKNKGYQSENEFIEKSNGYDLICYAYLKAMDDYFEVKDALIIAVKASEKQPTSFSVNFITKLIYAQDILYENSCEVYQSVDEVRENKDLVLDMKIEAIEIVFEYIREYKKYCK